MPKRHWVEWFVVRCAKLLRGNYDDFKCCMHIRRHQILPSDNDLSLRRIRFAKHVGILGHVWLRVPTGYLHAFVLYPVGSVHIRERNAVPQRQHDLSRRLIWIAEH